MNFKLSLTKIIFKKIDLKQILLGSINMLFLTSNNKLNVIEPMPILFIVPLTTNL